MLSPTPGGLAGRLGLPQPATAEDKILTTFSCNTASGRAGRNIRPAARQTGRDSRDDAARRLAMGTRYFIAAGGWRCKDGPPDGRAAAIWSDLFEIPESGFRPPPGIKPVMPDAARERLAEMLGGHAETRASQSDYAAATAAVFASPDSGTTPFLLLAEAGTGTGKTTAILPRPACGQSAMMTARYGCRLIPAPCNIKSLTS